MDLKKIIHEEFAKVFEDFRFQYDKAPAIPPENVSMTAKNALIAVSKNKLISQDGSNEGSGLNKAKDLAARKPLSHGQLKRMKAFFDNNYNAATQERALGKTIHNSAILQNWELWGGEAGKNWAQSQINAKQSSNKTSKKVRNPEDGIRSKNIMNPFNTRIHRESFINPKGQLKQFFPPEDNSDSTFEKLRSKYVVAPQYKKSNHTPTYWFPLEAEEELNAIGIDWYTKKLAGDTMFLVFDYSPNKI